MEYQKLVIEKRRATGLNQKQFAELLGLGSSGERTVSGWERGEHKPSPTKVKILHAISPEIPFKDTRRKHDFTFIDLFAGVGGIRLPFQEAGGKCVFTSEWDKFSKKTLSLIHI